MLQVTKDRVSYQLDHPCQQNRYDISLFNCEHLASSMLREKENDDSFPRQQLLYAFRERRYMWRRISHKEQGLFAENMLFFVNVVNRSDITQMLKFVVLTFLIPR